MSRILAVLILLFAAPALAASPAGPPDGTYSYSIVHSEHGALGTHSITVKTDGAARQITGERHIKVERVYITVYREDTSIAETWQDGVLQSYSRTSDYGDKVTKLTATLQGDALAVDADGKASSLPAGTMSTHFWNPAMVEQSQLFSTEDGTLLQVSFKTAGVEDIVIGGQRLKATRHEMSGGERRTLWFDEQGRLLKMQIHRGGDEIVTFQLTGLPG